MFFKGVLKGLVSHQGHWSFVRGSTTHLHGNINQKSLEEKEKEKKKCPKWGGLPVQWRFGLHGGPSLGVPPYQQNYDPTVPAPVHT